MINGSVRFKMKKAVLFDEIKRPLLLLSIFIQLLFLNFRLFRQLTQLSVLFNV